MRKALTACAIAILLIQFGCQPSKKLLYKGNKFYTVNELGNAKTLETHTVIKAIKVSSLKDKESYLTISKKLIIDNTPSNFSLTASQTINSGNLDSYAPYRGNNDSEAFFIQPPDIEKPRRYFSYGDRKPIFQALTIPLKFRPRPNLDNLPNDQVLRQAAIDSFPQQVESNFSVGFSLGYKFSYNALRNEKDALGRNTNQLSISVAALFGTGVVEISKSTARFLPAAGFTARKNAVVSSGGVIMLGFNNVNIGYAIGKERALGPYGDKWVFHKQPWHGFVIAFDVVK